VQQFKRARTALELLDSTASAIGTLRLRGSITGWRKPRLQAFSPLLPRKRSVPLASSFLQSGGADKQRPSTTLSARVS